MNRESAEDIAQRSKFEQVVIRLMRVTKSELDKERVKYDWKKPVRRQGRKATKPFR